MARGVRITAQRRLLIGIIQDASRHLDAAALLRLAKQQDPDIDRATVYRTIALLKDRGLIDELDLMHIEGEKHYYEAKTSRDHSHMACFRCGAVRGVRQFDVRKALKEGDGEAERFSNPRCHASKWAGSANVVRAHPPSAEVSRFNHRLVESPDGGVRPN